MIRSRRHTVVPPGEERCVWMTAGILSYQLCDRQLECNDCALDAAMRNHFVRREPAPRASDRSVPENSLRTDLAYTRNHCWVEGLKPSGLRLGLEPGLARVLLSPRAVVFSPHGQELVQGQSCLWIVMEGGTFPLAAPASGSVRSGNAILAEKPFLVSEDPFGDGWLLEMEPLRRPQDEPWLHAAEAAASYEKDDERLRQLLAHAVQSRRQEVGATLADGGLPLKNLADMLGATRYFSIVRKVFGP